MNKKIYCDMDGVLVNFADPVLKKINLALRQIYMPRSAEIEKSVQTVLKTIGNREVVIADIMLRNKSAIPAVLDLMYLLISGDSEFWATLPWMKNGQKLWAAIARFNPIILSSPYDEASKIGKSEWIYKNLRHLGQLPQAIFESEKSKYAGSHSLLVDDMPFNCVDWVKAGGSAINWNDHEANSLLKLFH